MEESWTIIREVMTTSRLSWTIIVANSYCVRMFGWFCEVVNLHVFEREYLCKNSGENNYGERCRYHGLLKLHCTLFCFFFNTFYGKICWLGSFVEFWAWSWQMICHRIWPIGFWKEINRDLIPWSPKSTSCSYDRIIRIGI